MSLYFALSLFLLTSADFRDDKVLTVQIPLTTTAEIHTPTQFGEDDSEEEKKKKTEE